MLPAQLGTGGNNTPFVVESAGINGDIAGTLDASYYKGCGMRQGIEREVVAIPIHDQATRFAGKRGDKSDGKGNGLGVGQEGDPMNTLTGGDRHAVAYCTDEGESRANELVVETQPTYCLQGSMIGRTDKNGPQGDGVNEDVSFTCNTTDRHAVAFAMQAIGQYKESNKASSLKARDYKDATDIVCGVDCRNGTEYPELNGTLQAKSGGGTSLNYNQIVRIRYIVRRLTPTECARLQGFADQWGHIEPKEAFTDEEYRFWLEVRNTHAAINGKKVQEYTKPQMLTWYNKLHTDSAEYKMWGNGIALPPALYVMQGIADALYHATVRANLPEHCLYKPNRTEFLFYGGINHVQLQL